MVSIMCVVFMALSWLAVGYATQILLYYSYLA